MPSYSDGRNAFSGLFLGGLERLLELCLVQLGLGTAGLDQLAVRAALDDTAVLEHQDLVGG